jgi:DNA polymerase (family 10)
VHQKLDMTEAEATARVIKAIENPHTVILGHPTGRLLLQRKGFPLDMMRVFDACAANRVAVEINANCRRLDCDWRYIHEGKKRGVKFSIGPDAHRVEGIKFVRYGVGIARKGWLGPEDVINTMSAEELLAWRRGK